MHLSFFSELNSIESIEFVGVLKMKITTNSLLQILEIL